MGRSCVNSALKSHFSNAKSVRRGTGICWESGAPTSVAAAANRWVTYDPAEFALQNTQQSGGAISRGAAAKRMEEEG